MRKKVLSLVLALTMASFMTGCGGTETATPQDETTVSEKTTAASEESVEATESTSTEDSTATMPVLSGTDFYILMENLTTQQPFEDYTLTSASDGAYYDAFSSDYRYYYSVHTNESAEIGSAEFYLMSDDSDDSFLTYCASLPYDTSEPEKAQNWVEKNIGKEKTKSFGDAIYTLSNGEQGPILTIKATGYDEYLNQKTDNYLSENNLE